ncbi:MAG: CHAT domain-containing protein, partial [Rubrivivax sp.]
SLSGDGAGRDTLVHLSLVLSASELALLPFELAKMPIGPTAWTESWMALQSRVPVVITRRTRNVSPRQGQWLKNPRVLFISAESAPDAPDNVPFAPHREALIDAVRPFLLEADRRVEVTREGAREQFGNWLTILRKPRFEEVVAECARHRYTCIHVLAHGDVDGTLGDNSFGLRLHPQDGVISGERLASAFTTLHEGCIHRPDVVSLATCDSGNEEAAVMAPGASIAHVLHQAGVPLVLASQFPLSKPGSNLVVREFYSGLLWGDDPWVLLHRVRTGLHGSMGSGDHDWASLVVYEALNLDPYKLDQACYAQCHQAMLAAWLDNHQDEDGLPELHELAEAGTRKVQGSWKADRVISRLPVNSKFFGMRALALRADGQLQNAIDALARIDRRHRRIDTVGEYEARAAASCRQLEGAIVDYEAALLGFLVKDGQGMNVPYRSLVASIRLRTVMGRPVAEGAWQTAQFWLRNTLAESADRDDRIWASACVAELWLLRTLHADPGVRDHARDAALLAAGELTRVDRSGASLARHWMMLLLNTYIFHWGEKRFEAALATFGEAPRPSFRLGKVNLVDTARGMRDILDRQGARERAAQPPLLPELPPSKTRRKAAAKAVQGIAEPAESAAADRELESETVVPTAADAPVETLSMAAPKAAAVSPLNRSDMASASAASDAYFRIDMLPAQHGDALWIEYGRGQAAPSRVLVDCGPAGAYKSVLKPRIEALPKAERHFELFILSHIDDDHIGGAIALLKDARALGVTFGDIWFNGWRHLASHLNAQEGEAFSALLRLNKLPWNRMMGEQHDEDTMVREVDELPEFRLPGGMNLTLLSPTPPKLQALARVWQKDIVAAGLRPGELETGQHFLGRVQHTPDSMDLAALAAADFSPDPTAPNGSSIAVLAEFGGQTVLLGADAHAPVLQEALDLLLAKRKLKQLPLAAFKLPHHGSQNNLSSSLLERISCRDYLVSTSGARFQHPDVQALARVVMRGAAKKQPARLYFNYRAAGGKLNAVWDDAQLKQTYGYEAFYPEAPEGGIAYRVI